LPVDIVVSSPEWAQASVYGTRKTTAPQWIGEALKCSWTILSAHASLKVVQKHSWAQQGMENVGAWILGRNMFGAARDFPGERSAQCVGRPLAISIATGG
jgi:hypothetical protein